MAYPTHMNVSEYQHTIRHPFRLYEKGKHLFDTSDLIYQSPQAWFQSL